MKVMKKLSQVLVLLALCFCAMSVSAFAETIDSDGMQISLTTDKEAYSKSESITATLSVTNTNGFVVTDVSLEHYIPAGYKLASGYESTAALDTLEAGETAVITVVYDPNVQTATVDIPSSNTSSETNSSVSSVGSQISSTSSNASSISSRTTATTSNRTTAAATATTTTRSGDSSTMQTSDEQNILALVVLLAAAGVVIGIFAVKNKKSKNVLSLLVAVVLTGSVAVVVSSTAYAADADSNAVDVSTPVTINGNNTVVSARVSYTLPTQSGSVVGKVCKASDNTPVENVKVAVYDGNDNEVFVLSTDENGEYTTELQKGRYRAEFTAEGYIPFTIYFEVNENQVTYMETVLLVEESEAETGIASGTIYDVLTGKGLEGVNLSVRAGWNNTFGDTVANVTTNSDGKYSVELPLGNYTVYAQKPGYVSISFNIVVKEGTTPNQNGTMSPVTEADTYRIVLTWGENPRDMDSHLVGQLSDGSKFHVYFDDKEATDNDMLICKLDVDDRYSYGPETITLNTTLAEPYYYYVERYIGDGTTATSASQVKVYKGENLIRIFNVPIDQGDGDYWNVFALVNGEIVVRNTVTNSPDYGYANDNDQ